MIGVFDSGVGGLTVAKEIFKYLPQYQIIYFGDTARLPYGTRGADFVKKYSSKITEWLLDKGAKVIVVACHTASAWASKSLKQEFKETPIFEVITPAAKDVSRVTKNQKIGIIGTAGSIKSNAWKKEILSQNPKFAVFTQACPLFVPLVEEGMIDGNIVEDISKIYLKSFQDEKIDTLVLACTHYPLLRKTIEKTMGDNINIINPAESLAKDLKRFLKNNPAIEKTIKKGPSFAKATEGQDSHQFFFSDEPYNLDKISHLCFNKKIKPIIKDPFSI